MQNLELERHHCWRVNSIVLVYCTFDFGIGDLFFFLFFSLIKLSILGGERERALWAAM